MGSFLTVYRASAGAGKTYTLAAEYIARLLQMPKGGHRAILAMTFTNKATAEMKERIMARLYDMAHGQGGDFTETVKALIPNVDENELQHRAQTALTALVHDFDAFYVQTIDRFFQRMLTALAHELGLQASFRVDVNDGDVAEEAAQTVLDGAALKGDATLLRLVNDYIRHAMDEGEGWKIADRIKSFARRNALSEVFQAKKDEYLAFLDSADEVKRFQKEVRAKLALTEPGGALLTGIMAQAQSVCNTLAAENTEGGLDKGKYLTRYLQRVADGNLKSPSKKILEYMEAPESLVNEKFGDDDSLRVKALEIMDAVNALQKEMDFAIYTRNSAMLTLQTLSDLRLLGRIAGCIDDINAERGRFLLSRTKWLFSRMVKSSDAPFVFEKMGTRLRHIMIDEFQDTARTQWENIRKLLLENVARGESCLIVGDVKQSIYRFNGGDWRILQNIEQEAGVPIDDKSLKTNFRSRKHIVEFNNAFFMDAADVMDVMGKERLLTLLYDKDTEQEVPGNWETGFVQGIVIREKDCSALSERLEEEESGNSLYAWIKRLHDGGKAYSDMAILVRWNKEAEQIVDYFSATHPEIPLVSQEAFLLSASPAVMTIVSALRWLADANDTVALAYCADAYQNRIMGRGIGMNVIAENCKMYVPQKLISEREALMEMPLYECVLNICRLFQVPTNYGDEHLKLLKSLKDAEKVPPSVGIEGGIHEGVFMGCFLDEILAFLSDDTGGVRAFLRYWDETLQKKKISAAETGGVSIVTIHKSKGLAYDTVLVPFCDWDIEKARVVAESYIWAKGTDRPYSDLPPYPIKEKKDVRQSTYAEDYRDELMQRRVENVNMLYVAFTRAKSNLLFWSRCLKDAKEIDNTFTIGNLVENTFKRMHHDAENELTLREEEFAGIMATAYSYGEPCYSAREIHKEIAEDELRPANPLQFHPEPMQLKMKTSRGRFVFVQSSAAMELISPENDDEMQGKEYIRRGNLLHRLMSMIRYADDTERALQQARSEGLVRDTDIETLRNFIHTRMSSSETQGWFSRHWHVHNECEIISPAAKQPVSKRPDRVMTHGKTAIVVDYKFGKPHSRHLDQVAEYMRLLHSLGYEKVDGYIWYMYSNKIATLDKKHVFFETAKDTE